MSLFNREKSRQGASAPVFKMWKLPNPQSAGSYQVVSSDDVKLNLQSAHEILGGSTEITLDESNNSIVLPNRASIWEIEVRLVLYHNTINSRGDWSIRTLDGTEIINIKPFLGDGNGSESVTEHFLKYIGPLGANEQIDVFAGDHGDGGAGSDDDFSVYDYHVIVKEIK